MLLPLPENRGDGGEDGEDGEEEQEAGGAPVFVVPQYACQRKTPMKHHNQEVCHKFVRVGFLDGGTDGVGGSGRVHSGTGGGSRE